MAVAFVQLALVQLLQGSQAPSPLCGGLQTRLLPALESMVQVQTYYKNLCT